MAYIVQGTEVVQHGRVAMGEVRVRVSPILLPAPVVRLEAETLLPFSLLTMILDEHEDASVVRPARPVRARTDGPGQIGDPRPPRPGVCQQLKHLNITRQTLPVPS